MSDLSYESGSEFDEVSPTQPQPRSNDFQRVSVNKKNAFSTDEVEEISLTTSHSTGSPSKDTAKQKSGFPAVVALNVGGYRFTTRLSTLTKYEDSFLAAMFSGRHKIDKDAQGSYFIDSNGAQFGYILDFLRHETLPPNNMALEVYQDASYYNIGPLLDKLKTSADVARMQVKESHRAQFPGYCEFKEKVIHIAIDNAILNKVGEVLVYAYRVEFKPRASYFNVDHDCVADTSHVSFGPWESLADEEALIKCLEEDFVESGFHIKIHEQRRRCKYYNGQNCQKCVYKLSFLFH